jgi:hypothetical protein
MEFRQMPEIVYLPEVRCTIEDGIRDGDFTVKITDVNNKSQYIHVPQGMINQEGEIFYLPVGLVEIDRRERRVLIELPTEADSGANRMWVRFDALRQETRVPA